MSQDYARKIADKLIGLMEQGIAPWQRPWEPGAMATPYNPKTGGIYKGINNIILRLEDFGDPRWLTFKQATDLGYSVKRGEQATKLRYFQYTDVIYTKDENGKLTRGHDGSPDKELVKLSRPMGHQFNVFNAEQIDGIPPLEPMEPLPEHERHARAENILKASNANITIRFSERAFYRVSDDKIVLPLPEQFNSRDNFYSVALHELGHWSGHKSRLNRDFLGYPFGSTVYAKEELRAEIASMMLAEEMGIGYNPESHAAYVKGWIKALQDDPNEIFKAAADAEKIKDFILAFENELEQTPIVINDVAPVKTTELIEHINALTKSAEKHNLSIIEVNPGQYIFHDADNEKSKVEAKIYTNFANEPRTLIAITDDIASQTLISDVGAIESAFASVLELSKNSVTRSNGVELENWQTLIETDTYLAISYKERYLAKAAGAKWDKEEKSWYLPKGLVLDSNDAILGKIKIVDIETAFPRNQRVEDAEPAKVLDNNTMPDTADKLFLNIPFKEKEFGKKQGAKWDKEAKSWYVAPGTDLKALGLEKYTRENSVPNIELSFEQQFREALEVEGLIIDNLVLNGEMQRVKVFGDKGSEKSGAYLGQEFPAGGYINNFKTGVSINWKPAKQVKELSEAEKIELKKAAAERQKIAESVMLAKQEVAKGVAQEVINNAVLVDPKDNAYTKLKGINNLNKVYTVPEKLPQDISSMNVFVGKDVNEVKALRKENPEAQIFLKDDLLIPAFDIETQELVSLQTINPSFKSFLKGGKKSGSYCLLGDKLDNDLSKLDLNKPIIIAEGFATAAAVKGLANSDVIIAFDSGNLMAVAEGLRGKFPKEQIIIAADNDHSAENKIYPNGKTGQNVGLLKAYKAAEKIGGSVIVPEFKESETNLSDWNDYLKVYGEKQTQECFNEKLDMAKIKADLAIDKLNMLANKQEQYAIDDPTTAIDNRYIAQQRNEAAQLRNRALNIDSRGDVVSEDLNVISNKSYDLSQTADQRINENVLTDQYRPTVTQNDVTQNDINKMATDAEERYNADKLNTKKLNGDDDATTAPARELTPQNIGSLALEAQRKKERDDKERARKQKERDDDDLGL